MSADRGGGPVSVLDRSERVAAPPVDPRLRARRIQIRRNEGRRRLRNLLIAVSVTVVCAAAWGVTRSPLLDVDRVEVTGIQQTTVVEVLAASGIELGDPLIDVDLGRAADSIAGLPWVKSVDAQRSWGGTVRISVEERRPTAVVTLRDDDTKGWLIDEMGWVLAEVDPGHHVELVRVEGIVTTPQVADRLDQVTRHVVEVISVLTSGVLADLDAIELDDAGRYWLRLGSSAGGADPGLAERFGPGRIRLGDGRDLANQMVAAETMLTRVDLECVAVIDVRVATAPALTRHEGCGST